MFSVKSSTSSSFCGSTTALHRRTPCQPKIGIFHIFQLVEPRKINNVSQDTKNYKQFGKRRTLTGIDN
jgi:hypothetical protein